MVMKVGMLGLSTGNGHPFSFSAIINGYSDDGLKSAGWPVIYDYVRSRHPSDFGVGDMEVTHAWTQDPTQTKALCSASNISYAVDSPTDMVDAVDAVIIARDDHESHRVLAAPFLESGIPVFIDKPLTLDPEDLEYFFPYLADGRLMSCSGMRYAKELDALRSGLVDHGDLISMRGTVINDWAHYGVHLLDAMFSLLKARPVEIIALSEKRESLIVTMSDGSSVVIDALGDSPKIFRIDVLGTRQISSYDIQDNFSMFRRTLWEFWRMAKTKVPPFSPQHTMDVMRTLMAGNQSMKTKNKVIINEL